MSKSADAFRTISEVADWLGIPAHVLRFWESKFTQVKPVKRAGGRRYYRPADMQLLGGIRRLLHDEGMTIKGVQKIMREQGVRHVAAMSPPLDDDMNGAIAGIALDVPETEEPHGTVLSFDRVKGDAKADGPAEKDAPPDIHEPAAPDVAADDALRPAATQNDETPNDAETPDRIAEPDIEGSAASARDDSQTTLEFDDTSSDTQQTTPTDPPADTATEDANQSGPDHGNPSPTQPQTETAVPPDADDTDAMPAPSSAPETSGDTDRAVEADAPQRTAADDGPAAPTDPASVPETENGDSSSATPVPPPPRVATIDLPDDPSDDILAAASVLAKLGSLDMAQLAAQRPALSDLAGRMADLRARMAART